MGVIAVLHTHSRRLDLLPHVHLVVPGASLDSRSRRWRVKTGYPFSHKALAEVFRAKLLDALKQAGLQPAGKLGSNMRNADDLRCFECKL